MIIITQTQLGILTSQIKTKYPCSPKTHLPAEVYLEIFSILTADISFSFPIQVIFPSEETE
jgi:hypothetical protein